MSTHRVPTVNDLRVKLCYICREEEIFGSQQDDPPKAWTHPCSCTLIAHEECLLKWIQTSQSSSQRADNALKCPQCGTHYELESEEPVILKILTAGNKTLQRLGRYFTIIGAASVIGIVGTSIYVCLTAYGAWAVEKFIGREMFQEILTDDPTNWPWSAYINLPLLPISLILSRFQHSPSMTIPLLLVWPPSVPLSVRERMELANYNNTSNGSLRTKRAPSSLPFYYSPRNWPPPPIIFGIFGLPLVRALYRHAYAKIYERVLGTSLPSRPRRFPHAGIRFDEGPFIIRIRANVEGDGGDANANDQAAAQQGAAGDQQGADGEGEGDGAAPAANANPNAVAVQAAEQLIEINAISLGRRIGGALVIPAISSVMGSILYRLSRHSSLLRAFLGIRSLVSPSSDSSSKLPKGFSPGVGPLRHILLPWSLDSRPWNELSFLQRTKVGLKLIAGAFWGGSKTWMDSDPVWWRNCAGFGLFVVIKDCIQLLHLYLAKRELESRRVKDRDFKGVDVTQLDLLPSFFTIPSS